MTLEEEVKYLIIKHDYSKGGVDSLTPKIINKVLDEVVEVIGNVDEYDHYDALGQAILVVESLRGTTSP